MSAYISITIDVADPKELQPYQELAQPTMQQYGIRLLGKSPKPEVVEGTGASRMTVLLEADSVEAARNWYQSPEYAKAIQAREGKAQFFSVIVPG